MIVNPYADFKVVKLKLVTEPFVTKVSIIHLYVNEQLLKTNFYLAFCLSLVILGIFGAEIRLELLGFTPVDAQL